MNRLEEILQITNQLDEELNLVHKTETDRTALIDKVNLHIEKREQLIQQLKKPYTADEIEIGQQIVQMNETIKQKMTLLYESVKADMKQVQRKKEQNYSYLKPYGEFKTTDGMYMDNKT